MKPRSAPTAVVITAFLALLVPARPAFACSCAAPVSDAEALDKADEVFSGTIVSGASAEEVRGSAEPASFRFQLDHVAKGDIRDEATVLTAATATSCGFPFEPGERYLVFAYHGRGVRRVADTSAPLHTNICTNTRPMTATEELPFAAAPVQAQESPVAAQPAEPAESEGEPTDLTPFALGTGLLSLVWLTYLLVRARAS